MKIIVKEDYTEMSDVALRLFLDAFGRSKVIGFATGKTPLKLYSSISEACLSGEISFKGKISFNLDEYWGIEKDDPRSFREYMEAHLFRQIDIYRNEIHFPECSGDPDAAASKYRSEIGRFGPIDFQILGIGTNGHIGFNEPGSELSSETRVVKLSESTIEANKPPSERAITMGIKEILGSKEIMLMASGRGKREALYKALLEKPSENVPASFLKYHSNLTVVADVEAAELL